MRRERMRLHWLVATAVVLVVGGVAVYVTARAQARARWVGVLDLWETRSEQVYRDCFPEVAASEVSSLLQRPNRVHPGKDWPEGFGAERIQAKLLGEVKETMLPLYVRHGAGWSLGHLLIRQDRQGLGSDLTVLVDLHGPDHAQAIVMH